MSTPAPAPVERASAKDQAVTSRPLQVFDNFLRDPHGYYERAIRHEFKTFEFPEVGVKFHGIAPAADNRIPLRLMEMYPGTVATLSFFRQSPAGQKEPHFIHTDADMGDWTAILYLTPNAPEGDGTTFWRHLPTGEIENATPHLRSEEGQKPDPANWRAWFRVAAVFNRLLVFPSSYFHSRAIFANYGRGAGARLTQVTFGTGRATR